MDPPLLTSRHSATSTKAPLYRPMYFSSFFTVPFISLGF